MSSNPYEPPTSPLPLASEASSKNGIWFVFPNQGAIIRAWSGLTGIERVYVDEHLVSEHRSPGKISEHRFTANSEIYVLTFTIISFSQGPVECRLFRGDTLCSAQRASFDAPRFWSNIDTIKLLVLSALGGLAGHLIGNLKWPTWPVIISMGVAVFLIFLAMGKPPQKIHILTITEEVPEPHSSNNK